MKKRVFLTDFSYPAKELKASIARDFKERLGLGEAAIGTARAQRELLASIGYPTKDFKASIARDFKERLGLGEAAIGTARAQRELLASIGYPTKDFKASIARDFKERLGLEEAAIGTARAQRELLASIGYATQERKASSERDCEDAAFSSLIDDLSASLSGSEALDFLKTEALNIGSELSVQADGTIDTPSKKVALAELEEISGQVIYDSSQKPSSSLEESINNLVQEIRSQKDSSTREILAWYIYPLLLIIFASMLNPIADYHIKEYLKKDKRSLSKEIKSSVQSSITDKSVLNAFRYVSADILNVRQSASRKSDAIGSLRFGYTVVVIEKRKSWTLIEWDDPDSEIRVTGWVFSRYLAKFN